VLLKRYIHDVFDEEPSGAMDVESGSLGRALPKTIDVLVCIFDVSEEGNNQTFRNIDYNFENVRRMGRPFKAYRLSPESKTETET
jgi:hypothetical protein